MYQCEYEHTCCSMRTYMQEYAEAGVCGRMREYAAACGRMRPLDM
jgi:hypothetical protein